MSDSSEGPDGVEAALALRARVATFISACPIAGPAADPARASVPSGMIDGAAFDAVCLAVLSHQLHHNAAYARFCARRGVHLDGLLELAAAQPTGEVWCVAPPVPTDVFKSVDLAAFPLTHPHGTFLTSGTTLGQARGRHHFLGLEAYEAGILPTFDAWMRPDGRPLSLVSLVPVWQENPSSSLSYMIGVLLDRSPGPDAAVFMDADGLRTQELRLHLERLAARGQPVMMLTTAFALVFLLDERPDWSIRLPPGSRLMETGGFKGRSRTLTREELYALAEERLGIPPHFLLSEYGMTELSSQLYDRSLVDFLAGRPLSRRLVAPPWLKVSVVDPATLLPLPRGERGLVRFFDLANVDSVCALQTSDLGRLHSDGLELLGRASDAEARGCSLTAEELIYGARDGQR